MKILYLSIIVITGMIVASMIWYFTSYDSTPVTKENNFGVNALVIHHHITTCPENCPYPEHYMNINSKLQTFLLGYNICDGNSCIKKDGLAIPLPVLDVLHPNYQELPLPDNFPWKDGDSINIQVKVPSTFISDSSSVFDSDHTPKIWVDLGESKITVLDNITK